MNARKQGRLPAATMRSAVPVVLAMLGLAACSDLDDPPPPRTVSQDIAMAGVCVNPNSTPPNQRMDDDACGDPDEDGDASNGGGFTYVWFNTGSSYPIPARGQTVVVTNGTRNFPKGTVVARGLPATGVAKLGDVRRYPPYVPAKSNTVPPAAKVNPAPTAKPPPYVPAPVAPPVARPNPAPVPPPVQRGGLGSTSGGTTGGTSSGS